MNKLPDGWQIKTLREVAKIITGKTPLKSHKEYFGGKIPFVKPSDLDKSQFINNSEDTLTELGFKFAPFIPKNSVLVSCIGNLGKKAILSVDGSCNQQLNAIIPNKNINHKFIYYQIDIIKNWMEENSSATTIKILNKSRFEKAPIILPPLEIQKQIAEKLDYLFDKIDKALTFLNKNKEYIKKYRLSILKYIFEGKLTLSSKNWQIKTLNEVCNIYTGDSINKKKKEENFIGLKEGLNYIGTKDISFNNIIEYENGVKIPFKDLKDFKIAKSNTSLLCIEGGSAGRKIGFTNQDVCFGNKLCCFEAIEDEPKFIYFYLQSNYFLREFNLNISGLIGGISKEKIKRIKIPIPPIETQKEIVSILDKSFKSMDEIERLNNENINNLLLLKKSLLKEAFSGRLI